MKIEVLPEANGDLIAGFYFYEEQSPGLGTYFLDSLFSDIDSLLIYAGIHPIFFESYRCLSRRFPFAIYYVLEGEVIRIQAVFDCRKSPAKMQRRLKRRR
jgi:hypothetical protein